MRIALTGWPSNADSHAALNDFFISLQALQWDVCVHNELIGAVKQLGIAIPEYPAFELPQQLTPPPDFIIALGGDGTFLDTVPFALHSKAPILGINFGNLGFLTSGSPDSINSILACLEKGNYRVESRTTLLAEPIPQQDDIPNNLIALNDITIQKGQKSMLRIEAHIDNDFLCNYWCDGLIVSTPTGSTAYSLSVGGPIIAPKANTLLIAPIAPHNLSMRALVIHDDSHISLRVETKDSQITIGADARMYRTQAPIRMTIKKGEERVRVIRLRNDNFYAAIREKLHWGLDKG